MDEMTNNPQEHQGRLSNLSRKVKKGAGRAAVALGLGFVLSHGAAAGAATETQKDPTPVTTPDKAPTNPVDGTSTGPETTDVPVGTLPGEDPQPIETTTSTSTTASSTTTSSPPPPSSTTTSTEPQIPTYIDDGSHDTTTTIAQPTPTVVVGAGGDVIHAPDPANANTLAHTGSSSTPLEVGGGLAVATGLAGAAGAAAQRERKGTTAQGGALGIEDQSQGS